MILPYQRFNFILILFLLFSSCEFDQDSEFFPEVSQSIFLTRDDNNISHLLWVKGEIIDLEWEVQLGIPSASVSDLAFFRQELWISSAEEQLIAQVDVRKAEISHRISTEGFQPHMLSVGEDRILGVDTISQQLAFWDKSRFEATITPFNSVPKLSTYRSGKFYIQSGDSAVSIWDEKAMVERNKVSMSVPIIDIQLDNNVSTVILHADTSGFFESAINFNTDHLSRRERSVAYRKIRYSPYHRQSLGKELLENVLLVDSSVNIPGLFSIEEAIIDVEANFLDAELWAVEGDSLYVYEINGPNQKLVTSFSGNLIKSFFYQEIVGE